MNIIFLLVPIALILAGGGVLAFFWTFKSGQYDAPKGDAVRILDDHLREGPEG